MNMIIGQGTVSLCESERAGEWERERGEREGGRGGERRAGEKGREGERCGKKRRKRK